MELNQNQNTSKKFFPVQLSSLSCIFILLFWVLYYGIFQLTFPGLNPIKDFYRISKSHSPGLFNHFGFIKLLFSLIGILFFYFIPVGAGIIINMDINKRKGIMFRWLLIFSFVLWQLFIISSSPVNSFSQFTGLILSKAYGFNFFFILLLLLDIVLPVKTFKWLKFGLLPEEEFPSPEIESKKTEPRITRIFGISIFVIFLVYIFIMKVLPVLSTFFLSLYKWDIFTPKEFVGLKNYSAIFKDKRLLRP